MVNLGATDYITKPFHVDLIKETVAKVLEMAHVRESEREGDSTNNLTSANDLAEPYNFIVFNQLLEMEVG